MKLTTTARSLVASTLTAFGAAMLVAGSAAAEVRPVNAGPLWNNAHANRTCPSVCSRAGATWTQQWRTTVQGRMSVCDCAFPDPTPTTPITTPTTPTTPAPAALAPGRYTARHPHWGGSITVNADHTYARDNGDPGTWTFDGTTLVLAWRNWAPESLTRQPDGSYRAAANGFTLTFAGAAPVPVPAPVVNPDLIVNGGFEQGAIGQGTFQHVAELPGWRRAAGDAVEVQRGVAGSAGEGAQLVELDAAAPGAIYQDVAVTAGASYELSFLYSPRPGVDPEQNNGIEVRVNGERVTTLRASGRGLTDTRWMRVSLPVRAAGASLRVEFRDVGAADGLGGYLDGVSLTAAR